MATAAVPSAQVIGPLIGLLAFAAFFLLRLRRLSRGRPLKLEQLWILPAILVLAAGFMLWRAPPPAGDWPWLAAALAIGAGLGWVRGSLMTITVDPQTHAMNVRASPAALVFIVALVAVRFGARNLLSGWTAGWAGHALLIGDGFLLFAVGLLGVQRVEMAIRARRLLAQARAAKAARELSSP